MPAAIIAVIVLAIIGAGAYVLTDDAAPDETAARTETITQNDTGATASEDTTPADEETSATTDTEPAKTPEETTVAGTPAETLSPSDSAAGAATYSATKTYLTPARTEHEIAVSLTVAADGTVSAANVVYDGGAGFSNGHQERFDNALVAEVVGKQLSSIDLSRVGGASLTTEAFNQAVTDIEAQVS